MSAVKRISSQKLCAVAVEVMEEKICLAAGQSYESTAKSSILTWPVASLDPLMIEDEFRDRARTAREAYFVRAKTMTERFVAPRPQSYGRSSSGPLADR